MKTQKSNNFYKFLSLLLIAVLVVSTIGFAVSGWDSSAISPNGTGENTNDKTDNSTAGGPQKPASDKLSDSQDTPQQPSVVYKNKITGLSVSKEEAEAIPTGIVVDPSMPLYGVSDSDVCIEFPIEDDTTRMLSYTTNKEIMWKIGALKSTRNYISNMSNFFGGVVVFYGNDDKVTYNVWETDEIELDLSKYSDCYYIENTLYIYTNENMIEAAKNRMPVGTEYSTYKAPPFNFVQNGENLGITRAENVIIPNSKSTPTALCYQPETKSYLYFKGDNSKTDMLTGETISFSNVFILFANSVTHENFTGTELVFDTLSGGRGYYISRGGLTEFIWEVTNNGNLIFKTLMGETLAINPGNSYIGFCKSSQTHSVSIS